MWSWLQGAIYRVGTVLPSPVSTLFGPPAEHSGHQDPTSLTDNYRPISCYECHRHNTRKNVKRVCFYFVLIIFRFYVQI